ncbi:hypothetical protein NSU_0846 [Novosphingobium pentaromativorans US6-1]|uniref:Uncharacterized protein n=1 Tax=Novosphingobium pentaromativorans US6-1 TaxID=1088721 RepID=G6E925_9SPHN|nr:hypothetical protein NSU_0846 [Novosphingobium pentaromativorans US6-1]
MLQHVKYPCCHSLGRWRKARTRQATPQNNRSVKIHENGFTAPVSPQHPLAKHDIHCQS